MENLNLDQFNPTVAELNAMVEVTKNIKTVDLENREEIELVRKSRIELKNARVRITNAGKELRASALSFQKKVIEREKELVAIIEPEEDRLKAIEEEADLLALRKARLEVLPARKERLLQIDGVTIWATDEELLNIDSDQYELLVNQSIATNTAKVQAEAQAKLDAEREAMRLEKEATDKKQAEAQAKIDADNKKIDEEKRKIEQAKEIEKAKKQAVAEEKAKAEAKRIKDEADAKAKALKEKAEAEAKAKKDEEEKKAEAEKLAKRKKFIEFRASHGWTETTKDDFKLEETNEGYTLYKKLGTFKK